MTQEDFGSTKSLFYLLARRSTRWTLALAEMAYWGETGVAFEEGRVLVFTCPHCGQNGFSQTDLYEHVTQEHSDLINSYEVVSYRHIFAAH